MKLAGPWPQKTYVKVVVLSLRAPPWGSGLAPPTVIHLHSHPHQPQTPHNRKGVCVGWVGGFSESGTITRVQKWIDPMVGLSQPMFALTFHVKFSSPCEISYCGVEEVVVLLNRLSVCWWCSAFLTPSVLLSARQSLCLDTSAKRTCFSPHLCS